MQTTCPHRRPRPASACSVAASRHVPAGHWSDGGNSCILTPCPLSHSHCRLAAAPELRMIYEWQEGAAWTEGSDSGPGTLLKIYQQRTETVNKPNTCLWKVAGRGFWLIDFFRPYFKNQKLKQVFWGFFVDHRCFCAAANEQNRCVLCQTRELTNLPKSSLLKKLRSLLN